MMEYIKIILIIITLSVISSCSQQMLVKYSAYSEQGDFEVLYSDNISEIASNQWSKNVSSSGDVFIHVIPKEQNQVLDVRVMYIANNGTELYKRVVSEKSVLIKGKIRALP